MRAVLPTHQQDTVVAPPFFSFSLVSHKLTRSFTTSHLTHAARVYPMLDPILTSTQVHCAAFSMFRSDKATRKALHLKPENDHRLMYQVISSAIVNQAPSPNAW